MKNNPFVVLMAEDDEHDIIAVKRAWKKNNIRNPLYIVNNGEECLDYLHQKGKYGEPGAAPKPSILMLDINMPKMDGLTALQHIRKDTEYRNLPVIILTTSKDDEDRLASYDLKVNAYIVKPIGFNNFSEAIKTINLFWELVALTEEPHGTQ